MSFTPATLAIWLAVPENAEAVAVLLESGDFKMVECDGGSIVLRTHSRCVTYLEVGTAPILPPCFD
jgi:hypothetical protein